MKGYVNQVNQTGFAVDFCEDLTGKKAMGEFVFTGLRKIQGFSSRHFEQTFSSSLHDVFSQELTELLREGLLEYSEESDDCKLRLTPKGFFVADSVFEFFV